MDFHSLLRRDLQFLCKKNKIPANMTNVAMADALKALEIVEGLDEYMNQSDANGPHSPATVAKQPPNTATRTTRRKTAVKAEPQSSSQLVNKSLAGEMEQEPKTSSVKFEASVAKTPAARSTRKASAATSCSSKVQESKKGELVQSVYSTRRSTRLLEKCMADLSLKTKETLNDKPAENEEAEEKVSAEEKNSAGSEERIEEAEVIPGRDLSASMEKEWEILKNDSDQIVEDLQLSVGLGDIAVSDANTEANMVTTNEVVGDEKESESSLVQVDKQEETLQAMCEEESLKKNDNDQEVGDLEISADLGDIPVMEYANTETNDDNKEIKSVLAFDSLVQVDQEAIQENDSEPEKINNFDEETMVDQTNGDAGDSETEPEEVDSDGTISEADSNQAVQGSDIADEEMILSDSEGSAAAPNSPPLLLEEATVNTAPSSPIAAESISVQFPRPSKPTTTATPAKNSAMKLVNVDNNNKENDMEMMSVVNNNDNGESKGEANKKKKKVQFDEDYLKDVSMRQLIKMVKEFTIKGSNNRTALQMLPGNNQIAE
ncbi:unnamed protein product [Microthlaspi erraticum]|uniref:Uncharacterized protein n=1 Tax=Microthlaspi erraticum TaxID=1685480 RepID=A0A6D2KR69_9BRAS|nr:unnamed protein product [Microthlaspi erraticum]